MNILVHNDALTGVSSDCFLYRLYLLFIHRLVLKEKSNLVLFYHDKENNVLLMPAHPGFNCQCCEKVVGTVVVAIVLFVCTGTGHWAIVGYSINTEQKKGP